MDSFDKFNDKNYQEKRFLLYNDDSVSEEDYKHAEGMWETFIFEDLGKYHVPYLRLDIPQLADAFDN